MENGCMQQSNSSYECAIEIHMPYSFEAGANVMILTSIWKGHVQIQSVALVFVCVILKANAQSLFMCTNKGCNLYLASTMGIYIKTDVLMHTIFRKLFAW